MQIIPVAAVASQTLKVVLAQQNCVLNVYQKSTGMYLDVNLEGEAILTGVLCRDRVRCVRQAYLGFVGDLAFMDTEGTDDPVYSGLGSRWVLMYLSPEDLAEKTTQVSIDFQSRINAANAWAATHPLVLTGALTNGVQGVPYSSSVTLQGQMANSALSWSVVGSLPAGLSLDSRSGVVGGTPTAGLTITSFTLKVKDNLGRTATSAQTVKIGQAFTMATQLPGIMLLTRPSIGTYFDPTAVLQVAANDQPRFDYDPVTLALRGLLVEEQRTNLLTYSSDFTNAAWLKTDTTPSTDGTLAPDGGPMQLLTQGSAMNGFVGRASSASISPGTFTASRFFKRGNHDWVRLSIAADAGGNNAGHAWFNLATGTVGSVLATGSATSVTSRIRSCGGGIYRCEVSTTLATSTANSISSGVTGDTAFTRVSGGSRYEWLGQLEAGPFATSPIPTLGGQVTRAADVVSVNSLSPWFNSTSGTILIEASPPGLSAGTGTLAPYAVDIEDGSVQNRIGLYRDGTTSNSGFVVTVSNVNTVDFNAVRSSGTLHRWAGAYATNNFALSANGGQVVTKTSGTLPLGLNRMLIGSSAVGRYWNGYIRRVRYYPRRLSNAELEALTA